MRGCGCYGVLKLAQEAFADRVVGWLGLRSKRPNRVSVHVRCPVCLRTWRFGAELVPDTLPDAERGRVSGSRHRLK